MQVMFIMSWSTQGYNSLGDPTRQHDNLKENMSGQRRIGRYDCGIFLPTKSTAACLFLQYTI